MGTRENEPLRKSGDKIKVYRDPKSSQSFADYIGNKNRNPPAQPARLVLCRHIWELTTCWAHLFLGGNSPHAHQYVLCCCFDFVVSCLFILIIFFLFWTISCFQDQFEVGSDSVCTLAAWARHASHGDYVE